MAYTIKTLKFDDTVDLYVYMWEPKNKEKAKAVIQISHGMAEHMERYNELAEFFTNNDYIVVGADHYAHGRTAKLPENVGVVKEYDFMDAIVKDIKYVYDEITSTLKMPHYLYSHSMGSMATQRYIELYPDDFEKVVMSGTDAPNCKYAFAKLLTHSKKGEVKYSKFISKMGTGSFNKKFKEEHPKYGWLTHDKDVISKYENDPFCDRDFPVNYYNSISKMLLASKKKAERNKINKKIKILLVAGLEDPVGRFGKGPKKLYNDFTKLGIKAKLILYPEVRHECHNESSVKNKLYKDVLEFYSK